MFNSKKLGFAISFLLFTNGFIIFTNGFNIDTKFPIIIKNTADGPNSHFGTTVVLINEKDPGIIVGSPKSNSTLPLHSNIKEPGVIWQCSFKKFTSNCRVVVMDPTGNVNDPYHSNLTDRKDQGWLGGALAEDNENFIACGSRWSNQHLANTSRGQYFMNGICYWRPKEDIFRDPLPSVSPASRILPIIDIGNQEKNIWPSGQAGFSVHIPPRTQELLLGAPGVQNWKGSVIRLSRDSSGNRLGNTYVFDNDLSTLNLQNNSYFGFAITSGRFFKTNDNRAAWQYVAGGPRGKDLKGHVVVFRVPLTDSVDILDELQGTQIGSYFGSSVCVADLNGDGWDDLLVGAPLHNVERRDPRTGTFAGRLLTGNGDEGTVFVYLSNKGITFQKPTRINGQISWAHFGTAIVNLGDINNDQKDDIAVGAPYANDGSGVVFIYHGAATAYGISNYKPQVIEGKSLNHLLRGFGYSLSSGKDIDLNGYNDLAVGAYDSGHAVVLRTQPLISVFSEVRCKEKKLSFDATMFEIESCVQYVGSTAPAKMEFTVKIVSDLQSSTKRVFLEFPQQSNPEIEHEYQEELYAGQESCTKFIAVVKQPLEITGAPVEIKQNVTISENTVVGAVTMYDIIRFGGQVNTRVTGPGYDAFCKTCPLIDTFSSTTKELVLPLAVLCGDDDKCVADMRIAVSFLGISGESFIIGSSPVLTMEVKIDNSGEAAIAPAITILWNSKTLKKTPPECQSPSSNNSFTEVKCLLGRTLDQDKFKTISFEFDMGGIIAGSMDELWIQINASTASEVANPNTMSKTLKIELISISDIFMSGSRSRSKFNLETLSPKTSLLHNYEIGLVGYTPIAGAVIYFQIPISAEVTKTPIIKFDVGEPVTSVAGSSTTISCYADSGSFKKIGRVVSKDFDEPVPGDTWTDEFVTEDPEIEDWDFVTDEPLAAGIIPLKKSGEQLSIECNSSQAIIQCMGVLCRVGSMIPGTSVTVAFPIRVQSSSLKNLFKKTRFSSFKYNSSGEVREILGAKLNIQPSQHMADNAVSVSIIEEEVAKSVSYFIYFLGIFLGLIILAILVYCFYKSGLFNRKKPQPTNQPEAESLQKKESKPNEGGTNSGDDDEQN